MNAVFAMLNHPLMREVGWTLLHSLWQGALVGVVFVVLRFGLRRRSANTRYLAGCLCLVALVATPMLTLLIARASSPAFGPGASVGTAPAGVAASVLSLASFGRSYAGNGTYWSLERGADFMARLAPVLANAWVLGVVVFSVRLTQSSWRVRSIRTGEHEPVDVGWMETLDDLRCRLGVSRPVRLLKSALVEVPTVIGWFRPVILLPAAALTGLTPGQLETILAHELAHVRRLDYVVNAFQCLVETLMFYHPVAWWISGCIREERENCCDDLVIRVCGDKAGYARALATLEGLRVELPEWAFAAGGGSLLNRIRRLVGRTNDKGRVTAREVSGLALLGIGLVIILLGVRVLISPTTYQSTVRIRLERDQSEVSGWGDQRGVASYDPYFIQTEFEVIQSEAVLGKVIQDLELNTEWGKKYAGGERLKTYETMGLLRSKLELWPVRNTTLIEIRVSSDKPGEAARIGNAIAEAYKGLRNQQFTQSRQKGIKALEDRVLEQEEKVKKAQQEVDALRTEVRINDLPASVKWSMASDENTGLPLMAADALRRLEIVRIESKADYVREVTLLDRCRKLGEDLGPEGLAHVILTAAPDNLLGTLLDHLGTAEQQLTSLTNDYGPRQIEVVKVKSQIEELHSKIKTRVGGIMLGMEAKALSLSNSLASLDAAVDSAAKWNDQMASAGQPYLHAKRNLEELQRFRQVLDTKIAAEKIELEMPKTPMAEIVDQATPALRPVSPNLPRALALIALGVLLDTAGLWLLIRRPDTDSYVHPA